MGTDPESGYRFFRSGFEFLEKIRRRIRYECYGVYRILCKSMAETGTEPDSESKIWRL